MAAVLVHIDLDGQAAPDASSLIALAAGRHVASSWGATLYAALIAHSPAGAPQPASLDAIETALARGGADKVVVALTDAQVAPAWAAVGFAWQAILDQLRPRLVLFGADAPSAVELAPRTGARIGARLLARARSLGIDEVELRDRDGGYARIDDGGAVVALVGRADAAPRGEDDSDLVVMTIPAAADARVEVAGSAPAEGSQWFGAMVALGDDVIGDARALADAQRLAALLGARLVGGAAAARAGAIAAGAVVDGQTPLAPELCVVIGDAKLDLAGATRVVRLGGKPGKDVEGALTGDAREALVELVGKLEAG